MAMMADGAAGGTASGTARSARHGAENGAANGAANGANGANGAVLLDKDGTLLVNVPYNVDPAQIRLAPTAGKALRRLGRLGLPLLVVSNQPGVALGRFRREALEGVRTRLAQLFVRYDARLAGFFYCPHHPQGSVPAYARACLCRKPAPGMLRFAAATLGFDLQSSWMIGDILDDVEAGRAAGCRTILVDCGNETEWRPGPLREPHHVVSTLDAAARIVEAATVTARAGARAAGRRAQAVAEMSS